MNTVKAQVGLWRKVLWVLVGVGCVLVGAPIAFLPWKLTCVETGRLDENIFIHCRFFLLPFLLSHFGLSSLERLCAYWRVVGDG